MLKKISLLICYLYITINYSYSQVTLTSSNLPIIKIHTNGIEIVDEPKKLATMGIIDNGPGNRNGVDDLPNDYNGNIGIEIRGSTSQWFAKDKLSYGFEIWDENLNDTTASLLGMPIEEDWVLHGPYSDKSLMRNFLAYNMGRELGRYASRTRYCELILNNEYKGVYVLMEKIKRDKNRVDISKLNVDENDGDDLTGGYIVKLDKYDGSNSGDGWHSPYKPPGYDKEEDQTIFFQYDYPKAKNITEAQKEYIRTYVTAFEDALRNKPSSDLITGYKSFINMESFIDYAIMNEISRNVDGYRLSTFLHKDKDSQDNKLYIGPIWDYNLAFGNADYYEGSKISGWAWNMNYVPGASGDHWLVPFWWQRFLTDKEYVNKFKDRWNELRAGPFMTSAIHHFIDSTASVLEEAQIRNFQRHDILGDYIWPNNYVGGSYQAEISYLKTWISNRFDWLDGSINAIVTGLPDNLSTLEIKVSPNPFNQDVFIQIPESQIKFEVEIYNVLGKKINFLESNPGQNSHEMYWNGKDLSGKTLNHGMYIMVIKENGKIIGNKKLIKN